LRTSLPIEVTVTHTAIPGCSILYGLTFKFKVGWDLLLKVTVSHDNRRELAEKATKEQAPEKLMAALGEELTGAPVAA
jgi:hypothetical protein